MGMIATTASLRRREAGREQAMFRAWGDVRPAVQRHHGLSLVDSITGDREESLMTQREADDEEDLATRLLNLQAS